MARLEGATVAERIEHLSEYVESVTQTLLETQSGLGVVEAERIAKRVSAALRELLADSYDDEDELAKGFNELLQEVA